MPPSWQPSTTVTTWTTVPPKTTWPTQRRPVNWHRDTPGLRFWRMTKSTDAATEVPMGIGLTAPVHSAAEGEGGDTNEHQAAWRADRPPSRTRRQRSVHTIQPRKVFLRGVTSNTCVCCAYRPAPSRIIASSRRQPSRNRISGTQRIR